MGKLTKEEITGIICNVWGSILDGQRKLIEDNVSVVDFKKGDVIYEESESPHDLVFLVSGKVKIHKEGINHRNQIVRVIKPGGMFGFRAFFAGQVYETTAIAFENSTAAFLPLDIIGSLIMTNPNVAMFFVKDLCVKLGNADQRTINLTQKHIRGRLADALLFLKESYGVEADGSTLCVHVRREELANVSNMTTSNAIRTLSAFAEDKLVAIEGKKVKIIDEDGLKAISQKG